MKLKQFSDGKYYITRKPKGYGRPSNKSEAGYKTTIWLSTSLFVGAIVIPVKLQGKRVRIVMEELE